MTQLLEWTPFLVFFAVYKLKDIYWATGALMLGCLVQLIVHRVRYGKFKTMHLVTFAVVLVLGGATLLLHDRRFIQWKPTVLLACASVVFLASAFIGEKPLARRMLERAFDEPIEIAPRAWLWLNSLWVCWLALLALLNLYVAWNFSEGAWVNFKMFGISIALFIFMVPQVFWLQGKTKLATPVPEPGPAVTDTSADD